VSNAGKGSLCILAIGVLSTGLPWRVCRAAELDLYGVAHLSYEGIDTGVSSSDYVHSNSSRLGIKGDQDLDYGLSVLRADALRYFPPDQPFDLAPASAERSS